MFVVNSPVGAAVAARRTPLSAATRLALSTAAALPCLLGTGPIKAQTTTTPPVVQLERVTVTANRFEALLDELPAGVTLITAAQIRQSGASTANEAIWRLAGVVSRLSLGLGTERTLDLRGFGATADNNTVYLVDGVRLNEGDSSPASLSWLPVDAIDRIEITRGSGAVLYGEGATGGVIHIITRKQAARSGGSLTGAVGNLGTAELRGEAHLVDGEFQLQVAGGSLDTDQHRQNFHLREHNASVKAQWAKDGSRIAVNLAGQSQAGGLPGGLHPDEAQNTPELSLQAKNSGQHSTDLVGLTVQTEVNDWVLASDASLRHKNFGFISYYSYAPDTPSPYSAHARAAQWGARGQRAWQGELVKQRLTVGTDIERWTQDRSYGDAIAQANQAIYLQDELTLRGSETQLSAGVRRMQSQRSVVSGLTSKLDGGFNSWELAVNQPLNPAWKLGARWGRSVRLANADEYTCVDYSYCSAVTTNLLAPQFSHDAELNLRFSRGQAQSQLRYYRHQLTNEIGFDSTVGLYGANVNFDPTRREGLEWEHQERIGEAWSLTAQLALRRAVFRSGAYAGKQIPLSPQRSAALRLRYSPDARHHIELGGRWLSSQRIGDDFDNTSSERIAGSAVLDVRYGLDWQNWNFALAVNNLSNHRYASLRTRTDVSKASVYPEPGRTLMLSARVNF